MKTVLFGLALGLVSGSALAADPLTIHRAAFSGVQFGQGYTCDATELVKLVCEGKPEGCSLSVDASLCEGKQSPGQGSLTVYFSCGDAGRSLRAEVGKTAKLSCQPE